MDKPVKMEELHFVIECFEKNKVLGKEVIPMEFDLALWDQIGPLLLEVLWDGIQIGYMDPQLTIGIITRLENNSDQLFLSNKRGSTLLNCVLKILPKLFQLRLTIVLQDFIIEEQNALLHERSIHRSIIITNKILHRAMLSEKCFLLMKLGIINSFDCMGRVFLYKLLERLGFGPYSLSMLWATNVSATLAVLIHGRLMVLSPLKRSVKQGCPLSSLLFLIGENALSVMLTHAINHGRIWGVLIAAKQVNKSPTFNLWMPQA